MVTKAISKRVNRSLWGGHFVIGPVLFPAVSSQKRPAQALRWLSITMCVRGEVEDVQHFSALYRLGGGERDGEVDERDCGGGKRWRARRRWYIWVVDQACENGRVRKEVERLFRRRLD